MNLVYEIAIHLIALLAAPKILYDLIKKGKYRKSLLKRFGMGFPEVKKGEKKLIWIHAVSLGETKAISPLVKRLKQLPNPPLILLSTVTETGFKEGNTNVKEADYHVYLPLDFYNVVTPIVKRVKPDLVILTETDFWWNFQQAAKKFGAKLILVNGKISEKSFKRLLQFKFLAKKLLQPFSRLCLQGPLYQKRFLELGVPLEKIRVTGNIKLDNFTALKDAEAFKKRLGITDSDFVITCGSTHDPEEKILLQTLSTFPSLKILLVPRHPERFDQVASLIEEMKLPYVRYSALAISPNAKIVLMDVMGQLRNCYQISHLGFVGGSFTPRVGGHNILEPCFYGIPSLFGPYMHSQPDFLDLIQSYDAGMTVTEETLKSTLEKMIQNNNLRTEMGKRGLKLIEESQGAIEATLQEVKVALAAKE